MRRRWRFWIGFLQSSWPWLRWLTVAIAVAYVWFLVAPLYEVALAHLPKPSKSAADLLVDGVAHQERLLERYKLFQAELTSFREMLHNSTNFVFVLLGGLVAFLARAEPRNRHPVLLLAVIGLLLLHYLHVVEAYQYIANIETMSRIEYVLAKHNGGPEFWRIQEETWLVHQFKGLSRNGLVLLPALSCLLWWAVDHVRHPPKFWQLILFFVGLAMFMGSLAGWKHLMTF